MNEQETNEVFPGETRKALINTPLETRNFEPIAPGVYQLQVEEAALRNTQKGNGQYLWTKMKVLAPKHKGRCVFKNFNIRNPSPVAQDIGLRSLKALIHACGISDEEIGEIKRLVGIPFSAYVSIKQGKDEYPDYNDVSYFRPISTPTSGSSNDPLGRNWI